MPGEATKAVHGGEEAVEGIASFLIPIYQTAVFPYPLDTTKAFRERPLKY